MDIVVSTSYFSDNTYSALIQTVGWKATLIVLLCYCVCDLCVDVWIKFQKDPGAHQVEPCYGCARCAVCTGLCLVCGWQLCKPVGGFHRYVTDHIQPRHTQLALLTLLMLNSCCCRMCALNHTDTHTNAHCTGMATGNGDQTSPFFWGGQSLFLVAVSSGFCSWHIKYFNGAECIIGNVISFHLRHWSP